MQFWEYVVPQSEIGHQWSVVYGKFAFLLRHVAKETVFAFLPSATI